ncbi:response regulator [Thermocaproicibacter melissae]|uniref:response regulator n=1 Tax=Thermocaproicibacter melissae TaxID=2966552 RepID=UPI0024B22C7C|nr:response regulator [Thermocaproicibacter melissae]WBY64023.1 response regulator [Thermocaproicibacter melissae]
MANYDCLLVDDEEALSQSTCEYFNMFGVRTFWAADEKACFDFLEHNQVKLILLDINLGGSSGFRICERLLYAGHQHGRSHRISHLWRYAEAGTGFPTRDFGNLLGRQHKKF